MRLGLGPIPLRDVGRDELISLARAAATASFDAVWVAEDRAAGVGGAIAAAALVAQVVPIRVGAIVDLGLYHPLYLAEDISVADISTAGRLEVMLRPAAGPEVFNEHLDVVALALGGAHMQWEGEALKIPARLDANQPAPSRLALNPQPFQPVVPIWLLDVVRAGFGVARGWSAGMTLAAARIPDLVLCPADVEVDDLLAAAENKAAYFVVAATAAGEAETLGRKLAGPLRMPEFPDWINA